MKTASNRTKLMSAENKVQVFGLLFSMIAVQLVYAFMIDPNAEAMQMANQLAAAKAGDVAFIPERSIWIIIMDLEQQVCFTLFLWAMIIIAYKLLKVVQEGKMLDENFVEVERGERIIPQEALAHAKHMDERFKKWPHSAGLLLPKMVVTALRRFHSTHSIQEVSHAVHELSESESERLDTDLSLIRYIAWAIPSIGFIGTVRGIGEALSRADEAIKGDISGVTASLGLAFNSTLVALLLSIVLMYFIHLLQSRQESFIREVVEYCRDKLVTVMKIPFKEEGEPALSKKTV